MHYYDDRDLDNVGPSSLAELVREQAHYDGQFVPNVRWLLSDFDTWERNPHYVNPKPWLVDDHHPEQDEEPPVRLRVIQCNAYAIEAARQRSVASGEDELPF